MKTLFLLMLLCPLAHAQESSADDVMKELDKVDDSQPDGPPPEVQDLKAEDIQETPVVESKLVTVKHKKKGPKKLPFCHKIPIEGLNMCEPRKGACFCLGNK